MFRKGRIKIDKDLDIVEVIRNQKIYVAALTELMGRKKIEEVIRDYYYGNVTSGDDLMEVPYSRDDFKQRTLSEVDNQIRQIELKDYPVTPTSIINLSKNAKSYNKNRRKTTVAKGTPAGAMLEDDNHNHQADADIDSSRVALQKRDKSSTSPRKSKTYSVG